MLYALCVLIGAGFGAFAAGDDDFRFGAAFLAVFATVVAVVVHMNGG